MSALRMSPPRRRTRRTGIGMFGWHSWLIFCRDEGAKIKAEDAALKGYCSWRVKQVKLEAASSTAQPVD